MKRTNTTNSISAMSYEKLFKEWITVNQTRHAKYYKHTTQAQYDVHTLHSNNLYQIFTYVKNKDLKLPTS